MSDAPPATEEKKKNYKDTLNLPQTTFPMRGGLVDSEPKRLAEWENSNLYERICEARKSAGAEKYVLHDGPPFANGDVHMGTALNKILKDLILKSKTMAGHYCPYIPGWDCHGLPIEFKVVQEARDLSPVEVRRRSEELARKFIDVQRNSFRRLGVFGDWENPYLTLDPIYEADILRTFAKFIDKGLVYQSKKPVYWSYGAHTALAEAEVEYKDKTSPAVFVKFPLVSGDLAGKASIPIWTTTPWTLPSNLAIALHPDFEYLVDDFTNAETGATERLVVAKGLLDAFTAGTGFAPSGNGDTIKGGDLKGSEAQHPFIDRKSLVIEGRFVTLEAGTGAVHIAPGHGQDDYNAGREHGLEILSPVDDLGNFTEEVGVPELVGVLVFKSNARIIEILEEKGVLLGQEEYQHSYPHCWRSKTPIIFRAVEQFFIRIDDIREDALSEIAKVTWLPHWGQSRIAGTVESRPDWCVSRQRTWGVPLPVFYSPEGETLIDADLARKTADLVAEHGTNIWFELSDEAFAQKLGLPAGTTRCRDTLDVWIDSGCSHVAVLDSHPELEAPCDLYLEATDQHRGWFQSSLMTSIVARGEAPYRTVLTHGFVVDTSGEKISKSKQDGKKKSKPTNAGHYYNKFGADIVRLWVSSVDWQNEVPFGEELFPQVAETYRRIRNTLRILLGNLHGFDPATHRVSKDQLTLLDRWILERLHEVTKECVAAYDKFEFRKVFNSINQFCANDLSALYVDITKDRMYCDADDSPRRRAAQTAMADVFESLCRLLAPILCYTADEAWEHYGNGVGDIHVDTFPKPNPDFAATEATEKIDKLLKLRAPIQQEIETARQEKLIGSNNEAAVALTLPEGAETPEAILGDASSVLEFFMLSSLSIEKGNEIAATVTRTEHEKCPRCWRHLPDFREEVCVRCADAID